MRLGFRQHRPIDREDQLAARPVRSGAAITDGSVVKIPIDRFGPFKMPRGATRKFELDAIGLIVWESCDGNTTLRQIIQRVAQDRNVKPADAESATLKFMQMLASRKLIELSQ